MKSPRCSAASQYAQVRSALLGASCLAVSIAVTALAAIPAGADEARPNRIHIEYVPPKSPENQRLYDALKERRALEKDAGDFQSVPVVE